MSRVSPLALCVLLGMASTCPSTALQAPTDPQLLKAAASLYAAAEVGALARDWCLEQVPAERPVIEKEYAAWRAVFGLPGIEAYLQAHAAPQLSQLQAAVDGRRAQVYTELSRASRNPADDCRNIRAQLTTQIDLPVLLPQEYALTKTLRAAGPDTRPVPGRSPGTQPGGTFLTTTMFTPLSKEAVLNLLAKVGSQPPYQGGGPLQTGVYRCAQQNTQDFEKLQSAVFYTLTLYGDQGLRLSEAKFTSGSTGTSSPLKDLQGTYRYDRTTGQLTAETDYANRDLTDYLFPNGRYDGVGGDAPLYNIFRVLTDGRGQSLMYGQKAYGLNDGRLTVCQHQGPARGTSPVAEARQAAQAEMERFNRYRLKPNAGLKLAQIEGLLHTYENSYDGINVIGQETTTLLLKDGTAYLNLRWSPHDLDVAASRKGEPKAWTKWRRQGSAYELLMDNRWTPLKGTLGVPAEKNEVLNGTYQFISSYTSGTLMNGATATTRDAYTFAAGKRFSRVGGNSVAGTLNSGTMITTGGSTGPGNLNRGSYTFDGYTLELRDENGQITRTYAFFWTKKKNDLMIGGKTYSRD